MQPHWYVIVYTCLHVFNWFSVSECVKIVQEYVSFSARFVSVLIDKKSAMFGFFFWFFWRYLVCLLKVPFVFIHGLLSEQAAQKICQRHSKTNRVRQQHLVLYLVLCHRTYIELSERVEYGILPYSLFVKLHILIWCVLFDVGIDIVIWKTKYLTRKTTHIFTSSQLKNKQTKRIGHLAASIKTGRKMLPGQSTSYKLIEAGPAPRLLVSSLRTLIEKDQYSQREDASTVGPSPISVPPWSPRRYLPLEPLMATRPCSRNSRKKSSGFSPSEHTRPLLETYQNFSFTPAEGYQWIIV